MVATSGDKLIQDETIAVLKKELFPLATIVTPNLDEAQILTGLTIQNLDDMKKAAFPILETGCRSVLVKGGHLKGNRLYDVYWHQNGEEEILESPAIHTNNTHGTGCSLSSAIAAYLALGNSLLEAVRAAKNYVHHAIKNGQDVKTGEGNGPLNHFFNPQKLQKYELE